MISKIPTYIIDVIQQLESSGFEAFIVGGCVRDLLLNAKPKDWDIATNAKPDQIIGIFPDSVYENQFGTVGIKIRQPELHPNTTSLAESKRVLGKESEQRTVVVEVTTYRVESTYTDKRHPDEIKFANTLEEDLSRRDFTINAIALKLSTANSLGYEIIDPFSGLADLEKQIIQSVGDANERFNEDALRMMRAIRFAVTLEKKEEGIKNKEKNAGWVIEERTHEAVMKNAGNIKYISQERIRDEFSKVILSPTPAKGVELLHETGLLQYIIPEMEIGVDVTQSHHHYYGPYNTVYKHLVASLEKCPSPKLEVRLAALFHDIGKPASKRGEGENATFYNHEYIGAKMTQVILERLRYPKRVVDKVCLLVRNHMFYYNVDEVGESGVRRVVRKVGVDNITDLIDVRIADRLGSGVPKAVPYKLRHFQFMVDKVSHDPISVKQLKINGNDLMQVLGIAPGPKIGAILDVLLSHVIDDPALNLKEKLLALARELGKKDLEILRSIAKERIKEEQQGETGRMKSKYHVE